MTHRAAKPGCRLGLPQTRTRSCQADRSGVGNVRAAPRSGSGGRARQAAGRPSRKPGNGMLQMNETCDRCGPAVRAVYRVTRGGELYFCGHCASRLWPALSAQGWASTAALRAAGRTRAGPWSAIRAAWDWFARAEDKGRAHTRTPD
jgi:hypothetical protein